MKLITNGCDLKTCLLCRLCIKDWIPAIASQKQNYKLSKGELLLTEGSEMTGVYFVYRGFVKVHKRWGDVKEFIVRFAKDGDIVGHRGLGGDNKFPISATALETTTVCFINNDFFQSSLRVNQEFLYQLMLFYASELKESEKTMRNMAHMPVKNRIAQALISLRDKFGLGPDGEINILLSRQDLASYTGTSYETLFRMMGELVADKIIVQQEKRIVIIDNEKLLSMVNEAI